MEPLRSVCGGTSLRLIITLLYFWMGCSMKSTDGVAEGREDQSYAQRLRSFGKMKLTSLSSNVRSEPKCWIYVHLQKSGGSTVKNVLKDRWKSAFGIYDSREWLRGDDVTREASARMLGKPYAVVAGGYTEGLRSIIGESCKWFVVFRHPVSRLVSAYFYCKSVPWDPLCASKVVQAKNLSLEEFAEHWGNFGLRQFVLGMVSADDVNQLCRINKACSKTPGWYRLKKYLDRQGALTGGDENTVMYKLLPDVRNLIHDMMDGVGLLEEFSTTLELFDRALEIPGLNWTTSFSNIGIVNKEKERVEEEKQTLKEAWTSAVIKEYISLDLLLYEHAVDVFNEKAELFGLK